MKPKDTKSYWLAAGACLALTLVTSQGAQADGYRFDFGAQYLSGKIDGDSSYASGYTPPPLDPPADPPPTGTPAPPTGTPTETPAQSEDYDGWKVSGEVFLSEVDTGRGPLRLAPFLSRASSIGGSYGMIETKDTNVETEAWQVFVRFVTSNGIVIEGEYGATDIDADLLSSDADLYRAALGYYVAQNTQVRVGYDNVDDDLLEIERYAIDIQHVQQLENGMTWSLKALYGSVTGDSAFADDDGSDIFVSGDWYFRDNIGVGVDLEFIDRDESGDITAYEVWANYFVTEKISLNLSYRNEDADDLDLERDEFVFEAKYRF